MSKRYGRLAALLFSDSRRLFVLAECVFILAMGFVLCFVSLSSTIVASKRQQCVDRHGKFLGMFAELDEGMAQEIMETEKDFHYEIFQVQSELCCKDERFFLGWVTEETGKSMGIFLKDGVWPKQENEILLEEYLAYQLGISTFPQMILLERDGQQTEYLVSGTIYNYSGNLSVSYYEVNGKKNYPSAITAKREEGNPVSLLVLQKKLDMGKAAADILKVMLVYENHNINPQQVSLNKYLDECYCNTEDFDKTSILYTMAVLLLLLLVEAAIFRAVFMKSRQARQSLEELGLSRRELFFVCGWQIGKLLLNVLIFHVTLGALWGKAGAYVTGYGKLMEQQVYNTLLKQFVVLVMLILVLIILVWDFGAEKKADTGQCKHTCRYFFRKCNISMMSMQTVFLIFVLFSFCLREEFSNHEEIIRANITAQKMCGYKEVGNYAFSGRENAYFQKESVDLFEKFSDVLEMYMIAETQFASLIQEKNHQRPYFRQLLELYGESDFLQTSSWEEMLSEEAKHYEPLPVKAFEMLVLPDRQYCQLLKENGIAWEAASTVRPECIMLLPYNDADEESFGMDENSIITVGRIFLQNEQLRLETEEFCVTKLLKSVTELKGLTTKKHLCILVLAASEAEKSTMISGYSHIEFRWKGAVGKEKQKDIDNEIAMLVASYQGGGSYSSFEEQQEDALYRSYAAFMGSTMFVFGMLAMGAFIFAQYYVNWERNKYEYGVFRSMGMSYRTLQRKLFVQYVTGIVFAWMIACFVVRRCFWYRFTAGQVVLSGSFLVILVGMCYAVLYYLYRNRRICDMLQRG